MALLTSVYSELVKFIQIKLREFSLHFVTTIVEKTSFCTLPSGCINLLIFRERSCCFPVALRISYQNELYTISINHRRSQRTIKQPINGLRRIVRARSTDQAHHFQEQQITFEKSLSIFLPRIYI